MSDHIGILSRLLQMAGIRHGVIASNIANVDTPGYKAKDVKFEHALNAEMGLRTTSPGHIQAGGDTPVSGDVQVMDAQPWADGNNVELDLEVAKMTENAMLFQAGVSLLSTKMRMFKNALRTR